MYAAIKYSKTEKLADVAGDLEGAVVVEDSEDVVEGAFDGRAPVASWQFPNTARDPFTPFVAR